MDTNKTALTVRTLLTVPQAAKRLGITQRRLRALLARPEYAGRARIMTLHTRHGIRWTTPGVPLDLLADLDCAVNPVGVHPPEAAPEPGTTAGAGIPAEPGTLPAIVYQKLLDEKDARIADLKLENQKLHTALMLAQNNLARQQVLRALPPPEAAPPAPAPEPIRPPAPAAPMNNHRPGFWGRLRRFFSDEGP
ncbi:MAG: hypothetical protein JO250_06920 [Armatimonadetes bacterium]|nr:hypothetical protein [Armatimonadota bacterium]